MALIDTHAKRSDTCQTEVALMACQAEQYPASRAAGLQGECLDYPRRKAVRYRALPPPKGRLRDRNECLGGRMASNKAKDNGSAERLQHVGALLRSRSHQLPSPPLMYSMVDIAESR